MPSTDNRISVSRLQQYQRARKKFACKVYSLAVVFIIITVLQWVPLILLKNARTTLRDAFYIPLIGLFVALLAVTIFIFCENLRFMMPCNCLVALVIVEGVTVGLARIAIEADLLAFGISFGVVSLLMVVFVTIGIWMKHDLTLDVVILFVIAIIFFIGSVFFVMLHILIATKYSLYVYAVFVGITILMFVMYHAQTINGNRYAEMRLNDYLLASLILYHDTIILAVLALYIIGNLAALSNYSDSDCNLKITNNSQSTPPSGF